MNAYTVFTVSIVVYIPNTVFTLKPHSTLLKKNQANLFCLYRYNSLELYMLIIQCMIIKSIIIVTVCEFLVISFIALLIQSKIVGNRKVSASPP